jgi:prepilin-type N-terminal cleavage/methylation domain-containing protein
LLLNTHFIGLKNSRIRESQKVQKEKNMKKKGFTLVELLVVIAIIALLMSILMPALARVRQIAYRMICGTNLSGIGKAMLVYANDSNERYPRAGGRRSIWDQNAAIEDWDATSEKIAFGVSRAGSSPATITASHYLLVKYADVSPKQFVCKGDSGTNVFKLSDYSTSTLSDLTTVWDFGTNPTEHVSYTYHVPYNNGTVSYPVSMVSNPSSPVASDKNPFQDFNATDYIMQYSQYVRLESVEDEGTGLSQFVFLDPWLEADPPPSDNSPYGNSASHQREGQNILFVDAHVDFERHPNVGIENDNIWLFWVSVDETTQKPLTSIERQVGQGISGGGVPVPGLTYPYNTEDAFLCNDSPSVFE